MTNGTQNDITKRNAELYDIIEKALKKVKSKSDELEKKARIDKRRYVAVRFIVTVLSVASPALITVQALQDIPLGYKIGIIVIAAVAGSAATLQQVFNFGESYGNNAITYLKLLEIYEEESTEFEIIKQSTDETDKHTRLRRMVGELNEKYIETNKYHIDNEIKIITNAPQIIPTREDKGVSDRP